MTDTAEKITKVVPFSSPAFESFDEERWHLRQRLAAGFRLFGRFGFDEGVAGHITARDPEHPDRFWLNPFGMSFKQIRASDMICVDHDGVPAGHRSASSAA